MNSKTASKKDISMNTVLQQLSALVTAARAVTYSSAIRGIARTEQQVSLLDMLHTKLKNAQAAGCTNVSCIVNSLQSTFEHCPFDTAQEVAALLKNSPDIADKLSTCIIRAGGLEAELGTTVLLVEASPLPQVSSAADHDGSCVTIDGFTTPLRGLRCKAVCSAVSKALSVMRTMVWRKSNQIMILCVSDCVAIDTEGVFPGSGPVITLKREQLTAGMRNNHVLSALMHGGQIGPSVSPTVQSLIFVFSFGEDIRDQLVQQFLTLMSHINVDYSQSFEKFRVDID